MTSANARSWASMKRRRTVYFTATEKSPTERHLYSTSLDTADPHQVHRITQDDGVHGIAMSPDARFYIDNFTSSTPAAAGQFACRGRHP